MNLIEYFFKSFIIVYIRCSINIFFLIFKKNNLRLFFLPRKTRFFGKNVTPTDLGFA